jgi:hypothetical protein
MPTDARDNPFRTARWVLGKGGTRSKRYEHQSQDRFSNWLEAGKVLTL